MKKLIVRISEGLGNQLFMYANAYSFSKKMGYDLLIDSITAYKKINIRSFLLDKFEIPIKNADSKHIPDNLNKYIFHKLSRKIDFLRKKKKFLIEFRDKNKKTKYIDYTINKYDENLYIQGYFESEKFFKDYKNDLIKRFQIRSINKENLSVDPKTILNENSVSIAIRQHRFSEKINNQSNINKSNLFVKDTINYIFKASEIIKSKVKNPKFYIFSNDTSNLKDVFDQNTYKIINHDHDKPINDFYLSTLCKHFIIGPSTFHWWSAYLGLNEQKICLRPMKGLVFSSNIDIFPENWIQID